MVARIHSTRNATYHQNPTSSSRAECRHSAPCQWQDTLQNSQHFSFLSMSKLPPPDQFSVFYLYSSLTGCSYGYRGIMRGDLTDLSPMGIWDKKKWVETKLWRDKGAYWTLTHKWLIPFLVTQYPVIVLNFFILLLLCKVCSRSLFILIYVAVLPFPAFCFAVVTKCGIML